MPVPTDQLAQEMRDLDHRLGARLDSPESAFREMRAEFKEIKDPAQRLGARLDIQAQAFREMRDEFQATTRELRDEFAQMRNEFGTATREMPDELSKQRETFVVFRTRVNTILAIASSVLMLSAGLIIIGIPTYQYERGKTEMAMANQTGFMDRLEKRWDELRVMGERLDRLSERLDRLSQENGRIQGRLDRAREPATPREENARIQGQLDRAREPATPR